MEGVKWVILCTPATGTYHESPQQDRFRVTRSFGKEKKLIGQRETDFELQELCWFPEPKGQELTLSSIKPDNKLIQNFNFENIALR